jgi:hypothetical protein
VYGINSGGAFEAVGSVRTPFGYKRGEGVDAGAGDLEWIVNKKRAEYDAVFKMLNPVDGKVVRTGECKSYSPAHNL